MRYPMEMERDGRFFRVSFRDVPEAMTQGESLEEPRVAAKSALETALNFYFEESCVVPEPLRG